MLLCGECDGAWPLSDYDDATRAEIRRFISDHPHR
jgi:hypothetical protein